MRQSIINHLEELRKRLIIIFIVLSLLFIISLIFSNRLIGFLKNNLLNDIDIIVISPFEFILTKLYIALFAALFLSLPFIFYEMLLFLKPALTKRELRVVYFGVFFFFILFILGGIFAYFLLLKIGLKYLAVTAENIGIKNLWSFNIITKVILFTIFSMGLVFQLPLVLFILNKLGIIEIKRIGWIRPYFYIVVFVLSAVITPTVDPITQTIVAIPIIILFELTVIISKLF